MKKEQLVETIRDYIYEVLEEELDRKLQEAKRAKQTKTLQESRAQKVAKIKARIRARKAQALKEAKIEKMRQLVESFDKANRKVAPSRRPTPRVPRRSR